MNASSLQLLGSRLTPQQLLVMVNAQIAANAKGNAATQSNAQIQSGTAGQAQAGGQYSGMAQNQGVAKSSSKGKARVKKAKFNNITVNSNNDGAEAQDPTKPKKATRPLNSFIAFRSKCLPLSHDLTQQLNETQAIIPRPSRASSRIIFRDS
jgi:hypothetical protein